MNILSYDRCINIVFKPSDNNETSSELFKVLDDGSVEHLMSEIMLVCRDELVRDMIIWYNTYKKINENIIGYKIQDNNDEISDTVIVVKDYLWEMKKDDIDKLYK